MIYPEEKPWRDPLLATTTSTNPMTWTARTTPDDTAQQGDSLVASLLRSGSSPAPEQQPAPNDGMTWAQAAGKHRPLVPDHGGMAAIVSRLRELADAVTRGPDAIRQECSMRVPAEPLRDADLVLSSAADWIEQQMQRPALVRYDFDYEAGFGSGDNYRLIPMPDGYWTPWHIAMGLPSMPQREGSTLPPRPAPLFIAEADT